MENKGIYDDFSNKTALNSKINKLNASIKQNYSELGVRYYNLFKDNPDPRFAELINDITNAYAEIKETEVQLAYLKGIVFCPNCNSECGADLRFCVKCGTQLVKPVQQAPQAQQTYQPQNVQYQAPVAPAVQPDVQAQPQNVQPQVTVTPDTQQPVAPVVQQPAAPVASEAQAPAVTPDFKFCTQCGNKVASTAMFCTNCGKSFNS